MASSWAWVNQEDTLLCYIHATMRDKHERLTSYQFLQHWRFAGQVNHYYILFHHTPCSALPKWCSCVLLLGQSRQGDLHAGTCWCGWSNLLHRSPSRESFELLLWNVEVAQQGIKVSIQPQTAEQWHDHKTYIWHWERLIQSNLHIVHNCCTEWQDTHKHCYLQKKQIHGRENCTETTGNRSHLLS